MVAHVCRVVRRGAGVFARERGRGGVWVGAVGVVLVVLGWYGAAGRATLAEQMPYIASGTIPGAALLVSAAVSITSAAVRRSSDATRALSSELHTMLTSVPTDVDPTRADDACE